MNSHLKTRLFAVAFLCSALIPPAAVADVITVSSAGDAGSGTLREALANANAGDVIRFDAALDGQTILVQSEPLLVDQSISIDASSLPNGLILDGDLGTQIMRISDGDDQTVLDVSLLNLTFRNGNAAWDSGGAIDNFEHLEADRCIFEKNTANNGGAIHCQPGSGLTLTNCAFTENSVSLAGGAIYSKADTPSIARCAFTKNSANTGGALYCNASNALVQYCEFETNDAAGGAAVYNVSSNPRFENCIFTGGQSAFGAGLYNIASNGILINCAFSLNNASVFGSALYNSSDSNPSLLNCTLAFNTSSAQGGGLYNQDSTPLLVNCILWGNGSEIEGDPAAAESGPNLIEGIDGASDPRFVRAPEPIEKDAGDLNLLPDSPAIDRADYDTYVTADGPDTDLSGIIRLWDADGVPNTGSGASPYLDLGAYEYTPPTGPPVITLEGAANLSAPWGVTWADPGAIAVDGFGLNPAVTIGGDPVDTTTPGVYQLTYDAVDSIGFPAIQVVRQVTVLEQTSLQAWAMEKGLSLDTLADSQSIYLERFAFGLEPDSPSAPLIWQDSSFDTLGFPLFQIDTSSYSNGYFYYVRRIDRAELGLDYTIQTSTGLSDWNNASLANQVVAILGNLELVQVSLPNTSEPTFLRLEITLD